MSPTDDRPAGGRGAGPIPRDGEPLRAVPRFLIVNADDFGLEPGVNEGIVRAHERGIVTSASLMVLRPAARAAAFYARTRQTLGVGLHLELGEWSYRDGHWVEDHVVAPTSDPGAVARETDRQLALFRELTGGDPTHIDSHQHVHCDEPTRSLVVDRAVRLGIPVRSVLGRARHYGGFYGQGPTGERHPEWVGVDSLLATLRGLPPGVTELACHPGAGPDLTGAYAAERRLELETLCHPRVRDAVHDEGIELRTFAHYPLPRVENAEPPAG